MLEISNRIYPKDRFLYVAILRPKINNHNLGREISSKKWRLDRSQFERRTEGEDGLSPIPVAQLNVQRRMRPEISQLISTVYPKLQDHPSVLSYPDVVGMRHNVFWLDHNEPEAQPSEGPHASSYCNMWEVKIATALVRHLVRQGEYKPKDIALLTPYTGQLCALTHALSKETEISIESDDSQDSDQESECEEDTEDKKTNEKATSEQRRAIGNGRQFPGRGSKVSRSLVPDQSLRRAFIVPILAPKSSPVGTPVLEYAETVFVVLELPFIHSARSLAIVRVTPACIDVQSLAMGRVHVMSANKLARCPSFCGEECPIEFCQKCCDKKEIKVDLLENKPYREVDLDDNPIVALGCGHFFTGKSLDPLLGMCEVYLMSNNGQFLGLKEFSSSFSKSVPCCPDCKQPIRQYATKRYNRLINRAIMDETTKKFLAKESNELYEIEMNLEEHEQKLGTVWTSRMILLRGLKRSAKGVEARAEKHIQHTKPLLDAIAMAQTQTIDEPSRVEALTSCQLTPGQQISLKAQMLVIGVAEVHIYSYFSESCLMPWTPTEVDAFQRWLKVQDLPTLPSLLRDCASLMERAKQANMPRLAIIGTLSFSRILRLWRLCVLVDSEPDSDEDLSNTAISDELLKCAQKFLGESLSLRSKLSKGEEWKEGVQETMRALKSQHKVITDKELVCNKNARIGGNTRMANTSALWYSCVNGHPFAVEDCGMSTEVVRCPDCEAPVAGTSHRPLDGVTRAEKMETKETVTKDPNEPQEVADPEDEVVDQLSYTGDPPETNLRMHIIACMIWVCHRIGSSTS
ncbi:NFX1-type zinc finger-containing protein [Fusarium mundagurra]|uniref:NFX1-type zinc finger-containing protein n=1 Tax=Fusarium mundagurra TaxID=1567541 RepID=A0A8H5XXY9_9HYPO|nr:NFX1-type zinc finger-containing protein [Fusarium mundagurra]